MSDEDKQAQECCHKLAVRVAYSAGIDRISSIIKELEAMKYEWQRGYEKETGRPYKEINRSQ